MDTWLTVLIELGVLAFFGLLYYIIQKRRILRKDKEDIFYLLEQLIYELHHFLEENKQQNFYSDLNKICLNLELQLENKTLNEIQSSLNQIDTPVPEKIQELINKLHFHLDYYR